jgi:murein L,D-transpeptidase YcbB/YkuD
VKRRSLVALVAFAITAFPAFADLNEDRGGSVAGVTLTRVSVNRNKLEDRNLTVSDWKIRLTNTSPLPRWVATVAQKSPSTYLVKRNPKQVSYLVLEKRGEDWSDSQTGWSTVIGPKNSWITIEPGESFEFTVPIPDRFKTDPATVRLSLQVATDPEKKDVKTLLSEPAEHKADPKK